MSLLKKFFPGKPGKKSSVSKFFTTLSSEMAKKWNNNLVKFFKKRDEKQEKETKLEDDQYPLDFTINNQHEIIGQTEDVVVIPKLEREFDLLLVSVISDQLDEEGDQPVDCSDSIQSQVLSNTVDDSSNIQNNSSDSSAELEQEVDVSNSLPSNDGDDQCEEDKVPQLTLISTSQQFQQSRWINYGPFIGVRPVLVRSGQFSTIIYNFAQLVKDFDIFDKNDLKKFILTKLKCKGGIDQFTDQLILNNRKVKQEDLVVVLRQYARERCTVGSDFIQILTNTVIDDSSNSSDAEMEQEVGASINPLLKIEDDQCEDVPQLLINQDKEVTAIFKESTRSQPEVMMSPPPVVIFGASGNDKPQQKTVSTAQNKNSTSRLKKNNNASNSISINKAEADDPFYRYKMPPLELRNKGNKTVIMNLDEVAASVDRPPAMIMAHFKSQLGTGIECSGDRFIINGIHKVETLQEILYHFISNYVLCRQCLNPETTITNSKSNTAVYEMKCKACGFMQPRKMSKYPLLKFYTNIQGGLTKKQLKHNSKVLAQKENFSKLEQ